MIYKNITKIKTQFIKILYSVFDKTLSFIFNKTIIMPGKVR